MRPRIEADGEMWEARLDRHEPHPGIRAVVFSCISNPQRAYHVVEVPADEIPAPERLATLPGNRLSQLFADSDPMDVAHDPAADPTHEGGHPLPSEPPGAERRDRG